MYERDKYFLIIITVLVIIILILLFFTRFGKIENKYLKPTGNIDVFNIDIGGTCNCKNDENCSKNEINNNSSKSTADRLYPVWNEEKDKNELNKIFVDDKNGDYIYQKNLSIFNNAFYEYTNKIAPGVSNTYYFVVHNNSDMNIKYYLEMYSDTKYDINLRYRLKRNGKYVIGNSNKWVTANELKTSFTNLNIKDSDKYSLDWKWEYESGNDKNDTYVGENMDDLYKLNVRFYFEQV